MQEVVKLDTSQELYIIINLIITRRASFVFNTKLNNFAQIKSLICLQIKKLLLRYKNKRIYVCDKSCF